MLFNTALQIFKEKLSEILWLTFTFYIKQKLNTVFIKVEDGFEIIWLTGFSVIKSITRQDICESKQPHLVNYLIKL